MQKSLDFGTESILLNYRL